MALNFEEALAMSDTEPEDKIHWYTEMLREAKEAGVTFYKLPTELSQQDIDPLMRLAVNLINESGWVWTAESCQGHPDAASPMETAWPHNTRPMLRLVCRKNRLGKMLELLHDGWRVVDRESEGEFYAHPGSLIIHPHGVKGDWAEVIVYVEAASVWQRDLGIKVFGNFGALLALPGSLADVLPPDALEEERN